MADAWPDDGLDAALASACELAEAEEEAKRLLFVTEAEHLADEEISRVINSSHSELSVDLTKDKGYHAWQEAFETQNLQNELFSDASNPENKVDVCKPWQSLDTGSVPSTSTGRRNSESTASDISCDEGLTDNKPMELSKRTRGPSATKEQDASARIGDVHDGPMPTKRQRVLGELNTENQPIHSQDCKVPKEEDLGRAAPSGILSASGAYSVRWRNRIFHGISMHKLFHHCNGLVSDTNHLIHDILTDVDGRRVNLLLEQLSSTRKPNGLWAISTHRCGGSVTQLVIPGTLPSRLEAIEVAKLINAGYETGPDRHAHIIHVCPWASNYCRCKALLQGIAIKQQSWPSKPWHAITERYFSNIIEYLMCYPRQLCIFEIGCAPVDISLPSSKRHHYIMYDYCGIYVACVYFFSTYR